MNEDNISKLIANIVYIEDKKKKLGLWEWRRNDLNAIGVDEEKWRPSSKFLAEHFPKYLLPRCWHRTKIEASTTVFPKLLYIIA